MNLLSSQTLKKKYLQGQKNFFQKTELQKIETSVEGLFEFSFKDDLERRPHQICATANRLEGRLV